MLDLVRFELKKLLARRTSQVVAVGVLALLCVIMALNVVQTKTRSDAGEIVGGTAAIAQQKARAKEAEERFTREKARREKMYAEQEKLHEMRNKWLEDMEKISYKGNDEKDGEP